MLMELYPLRNLIFRRAFKDLEKKRDKAMGGEPKPDDHPHVVELRRRLVGLLEECAEYNLFWWKPCVFCCTALTSTRCVPSSYYAFYALPLLLSINTTTLKIFYKAPRCKTRMLLQCYADPPSKAKCLSKQLFYYLTQAVAKLIKFMYEATVLAVHTTMSYASRPLLED